MIEKEAQGVIDLVRPSVDAVKAIYCEWVRKQNEFRGRHPLDCHWRWKVRRGQWYLDYGNNYQIPWLVTDGEDAEDIEKRNLYQSDSYVPILEGEEIERFLGECGYGVETIRRCLGSEGSTVHCTISVSGKRKGYGWDRKHGRAVMLAVIALVEKLGLERR